MARINQDGRNIVNFSWVLENFPYCWHKKGEKIVSPSFIVDTIDNSKWSLSLYPRGEINGYCVACYLHRAVDSKGPANLTVDCDLSFLDADGSTLVSAHDENICFTKGKSVGRLDFCKRDDVYKARRSRFIPQGTLTARCRMWLSVGRLLRDEHFFARTLVGVEKKSFLWEIENFSSLKCRRDFRIKSASSDMPIMRLGLFSCVGDGWEENVCIDFSFSDPKVLSCSFKMSILDVLGDKLVGLEDVIWPDGAAETGRKMLLKTRDELISKKNLYLPKGVLTLLCEFAFSRGALFEEVETLCCGSILNSERPGKELSEAAVTERLDSSHTVASLSDIANALKNDLVSMLNSNTLCDVKLCTKTESFPAHWFVLSARSRVFRAMYSSDMKEKAKDSIDISDIDADTVRRMLLYMYTDSMEEVHWKNASTLYVAADKYDILSLKNKCSVFLKDKLCKKNACELMALADLHSDDDLKKVAQDFILKNDNAIIKSKEWQLLMETNIKLAAETMFLKYKE